MATPNEEYEDDERDFDYSDDGFDDDYEQEIVGYYCMCCGSTQATSGMGHTCNKCGAGALDEIYF